MQAHFINYGTGEDFGFREVAVESLKLDGENRPYMIVSNPFFPGDSIRAEYMLYEGQVQWMVDLD